METQENTAVSFGEFEVDAGKRVLRKGGEHVSLNPKTLDLLLVLIENRGEILSKKELLDKVWANQFVEENNLTVHIAALRKAFGEKKNEHRYIVTVPGKGYKFVAELNHRDGGEITVETRKFERVIIEEEIGEELPVGEKIHEARRLPALPNNFKKNSKISMPLFYSGIGVGVLVIILGFWFFTDKEKFQPSKIKFTKLTNSGRVTNAALTPDNKYAVFAQTENGGESLWLRHIATGSQNQILKPQPINYVGLTVSPDGNFIYATVFSGNFSDPQVWRIPLLGGATEQIPNVKTGAGVSLSPDGKRFAFTESKSAGKETLFGIIDANGENKKILVRAKDENRSFPNFKTAPVAWSPDGGEIACVVEEKTADGGNRAGILLINPEDGRGKFISEQRWDYVEALAWIDTETLALTASAMNQGQIWTVSRKTGEARQITTDLGNYLWLASAGGNLLTVQKAVVSKVGVADFDEAAKKFERREVFEESGYISNVNWTPDEKILYTSAASGQPEIWLINLDGSDRTQLTVNSNVSFGLSVSPTDGSLVFGATENGKHALRLTDSAGKNMLRLTDGAEDVWANFMPDGQSVIFQRGLNNKAITLWRLDLNDGKLTQLTQKHGTHPAVSPDGNKTAYYFMDQETDHLWRIGLVSNSTKDFLGKINLSPEATARRMRWHPNGNFLSQIAYRGEEIILLLLPTSGGEAQEIHGLGKGGLEWFEWSKDGRKIVVSQTAETQNLVLLSQ